MKSKCNIPGGKNLKKFAKYPLPSKNYRLFQLFMHLVKAEKNNVNIFLLQLSLIWHAIIISGSVSKWLETLLSAIFPTVWQFYKFFYWCTWNQYNMGVTIILNFFMTKEVLSPGSSLVELPDWPLTYCDYGFGERKIWQVSGLKMRRILPLDISSSGSKLYLLE